MQASKYLILSGYLVGVSTAVAVVLFVRIATPGHGDLGLFLIPMLLMILSYLSVAIGVIIGVYQLISNPVVRTRSNTMLVAFATIGFGVWTTWQLIQ